MRLRMVAVAAFVFLTLFMLYSKVSYATNTLPDPNRTTAYVENLISSYNALVDFNYSNRPDFDSIKSEFSLYHDVGNTFKVVIVQSVPNDSRFIFLLFIPMGRNQPLVVMDYDDTFTSLFPHSFYVTGEYNLLENNLLSYNNTEVRIGVAFEIMATDISGDYMTNSKNAAVYILEQDAKNVPPLSSQSPTTIVQIETTTSTSSNPWSNLWEYIGEISAIIGIPSGLLYLYKEGYLGGPKSKRELRRKSKDKQRGHSNQSTESQDKEN